MSALTQEAETRYPPARFSMGERRLDLVELFWLCKACDANAEKIAQRLLQQFEEIQDGK